MEVECWQMDECSEKKKMRAIIISSVIATPIVVLSLTFGVYFGLVKETTFPLDMAPNSIDDKYDGCRDEAFKRVDGYYLPHEKNTTTNFRRAWDIAEKHASIPKDGLQKVHSIAMYSYTNNKPQPPSENIYIDFNEAVRQGRYGYGRSFQYHSLHFYLTDAIQILKQSQTTCRTTYRRTKVYFDRNVLNKEIRFGIFASSSLNKSLHMFGNTSCFEINTCFGANLTYYSAYLNESEVLIPSYEVFRVTAVQTNTWCDVVYTLNSTGISKSNLNCSWVYNGAESNLRSRFYTFIRASDTDYIMLFIMLINIVFH